MTPSDYQPPGQVILRTEVGSRILGTSADDGVDDHDELAIVVERPIYVFGLRRWESHVVRTAPEGERSSAGDLDLTYHALRKYVRLACAGNPSMLLPLYAQPPFVYVITPEGQALQDLASDIVSLKAIPRFRGYMRAQALRLLGLRGGKSRGKRTGARPELVAHFGYDTKFAMHMIRLGLQGLELADTGKLTLPMPAKERLTCHDIRTGRWPLDDVLNYAFQLDGWLGAIEDGTVESDLRPSPVEALVEEFLEDTYTRLWSGWKEHTYT